MMENCIVLDNAYIKGGGVRFDILKFVLAMFIVAMHCGLFPRWVLPVPRLAVPLFFIMTSYFFHIKLCETKIDLDRLSRLWKFVKRNLHLYFFWSIALLPFIVILHLNWFKNGVLFAIAGIFKSLFLTGFFGASWFILASVSSVIIVFFLSRYLKNGWLILISLLVYVFALLDSNYGGLLSSDTYDKLSSLGIRWSLNMPASLIWIVLGKVLAEKPLYVPKRVISPLMLLAFGAYYGEYYIIETFGWSVHTDCFLFSIPLCVLIFVAIAQTQDVNCKYSFWLRKTSIIVYCVHKTLIDVVKSVCHYYNLEVTKAIIFLMILVICLCISSLIIWLHDKRGFVFLQYAY